LAKLSLYWKWNNTWWRRVTLVHTSARTRLCGTPTDWNFVRDSPRSWNRAQTKKAPSQFWFAG
jgi:hypothetical protein